MKQKALNVQLRLAARSGDLAAVEQALEDGANARDADSGALSLAAEAGHVECVRLLLPVSEPMANESCALRRAASGGHVECVRLLIPVSEPLARQSYALRWAAEKGHADCVALLLPASDPLAVGDCGLDAARLARSRGHLDLAGMIDAFMEARALSGAAQNAKMSPRAKSSL
jgi:ankyrin repeat protein